MVLCKLTGRVVCWYTAQLNSALEHVIRGDSGLMAEKNSVCTLVVDRDSGETDELVAFLKSRGHEVLRAADGERAYNILDKTRIDVMIAELGVHRINGMRLLEIAKARNPEVCVVLIASHADIPTATEALRQGAYDFQTKPLNFGKLEAVINRAISHQRLVVEKHELERQLDVRFGMGSIIGNSPQMIDVYNKTRQFAPTNATVLIHGPTGSGKDLIARAVHRLSRRQDEPFVKLNCAALPEGLVESELFGHVKGAFTGAVRDRAGRFKLADGGTLFLDEICSLSLPTQAKLLQVLEEGRFEPVGSSRTTKVDVRLIAASNINLETLSDEGKFRRDLFYRLKVARIDLPPLSSRIGDIPLLVDEFIRRANKRHGKNVSGVTRGVISAFMRYSWPGNVRELENTVEQMVILGRDNKPLDVADVPDEIKSSGTNGQVMTMPVGISMAEVERIAIEKTLQSTGYDKEKTAETLKIGLRTLYRKLKEYGLN